MHRMLLDSSVKRMLPLALALSTSWLSSVSRAQAGPTDNTTPASVLVNATTPGALAAYTTILSAGFEWTITGDDDNNCAVTLEYRLAGSSQWNPAQPLMRVDHGLWTHGEDPGNLLAGSLFLLQPGTPYEARLTLSDADGGADQRIVAFTTRTEPVVETGHIRYVKPGSGGGSGTQADPFRGLAAADAVAQPGDTFILTAGSYHGQFIATHDGTAAQPIAYWGESAATVLLDGDGSTNASTHCVDLAGRKYITLANLTASDCLRPLSADHSTGIVIRGCTIRPINQLVSTVGIHMAISQDAYIADNTILMPGQWATIGRTGAYGTGGYGILIEGTGHIICRNKVVEAWDAISFPVTGTAVPACITSNVDIYDNDVDRATDDAVQADAVHHNVRIFRNRLLNTGSPVSFQPAFGGPGYVLYNEAYNTRIEPYKLHQETSYGWTQETSGFFIAHNTCVVSRSAWYATGIWHHATLRNNLFLGGRVGAPSFQNLYHVSTTTLDADGYNRVNGYADLVLWDVTHNYADLPAFYDATGNEQHGVEVTTGNFMNLALPHNPEWNYVDGYGYAYATTDYDLRLASGSMAIDKGVVLANIDDGYLGAAPDMGCYESGAVLPVYGPRPPLGVPTGVTPTRGVLALAPSVPNPFADRTEIPFTLSAAGRVALAVYDLRGARVRTLVDGDRPAGPQFANWDGRNDAGELAAAGVYFVRLSTGPGSLTRRIALMR